MSLKIDSPRPPQIKRAEPRLEKPKPAPARETAGRVSPRRVRDGYDRPSAEPKSRAGSSFESGRAQGAKAATAKSKTAWEPSEALKTALSDFVKKVAEQPEMLSKKDFAAKLKDFLKEQKTQAGGNGEPGSGPAIDSKEFHIPRGKIGSIFGHAYKEYEQVKMYSRGKFANDG